MSRSSAGAGGETGAGVLVGGVLVPSFVGTYAWCVANHNTLPNQTIPFLSTTIADAPQSSYGTFVLVFAAIALGIIVTLRYHVYQKRAPAFPRWHKAHMSLGILSAVGLIGFGSFQYRMDLGLFYLVHLSFVFIAFVSANMYFVVGLRLDHHLRRGKPTWVVALRYLLVILSLVASVLTGSFMLVARLYPEEQFLHTLAAVFEYAAFMMFMFNIASFVFELRGINVELKVSERITGDYEVIQAI